MGSSIRTFSITLLALAASGAAPATAQIYSNGVPDGVNAYNVSPPYSVANDFPLLTTTSLGSFDWYAARTGPQPGGPATISANFNWYVYLDASGQPGSVVGSGTATNATGTLTPFPCCTAAGSAYDLYLFSGVSFGGLSLGPGTYWLGLNGYAESGADAGYWATSLQTGNQMQDFGDGTWQNTGVEGAFSIYAEEVGPVTVPEPATLTLLATGVVGLFGSASRRRVARGSIPRLS